MVVRKTCRAEKGIGKGLRENKFQARQIAGQARGEEVKELTVFQYGKDEIDSAIKDRQLRPTRDNR